MEQLKITISGTTASGKTTIQEYIAQLLGERFSNVTIDYGVDGDPNRSEDVREKCVTNLVNRGTKININTLHV